MIYGYCRISTAKQNLERQARNIKQEYPDACIVNEIYTGTRIEGRQEFNKMLNAVKSGDTIVFDAVSRMSRNAEEGYAIYEKLYNDNVELVFLKEPHINTSVYRKTINSQIKMTGGIVDVVLQGINSYLLLLAKEQIKIAFQQSEKEVSDLRQRTREGIQTARLEGKQIGQVKGIKIETKKAKAAKEIIKKKSKTFGGYLTDGELIKICGLARGTYYKYKRELLAECQK